MSAGIFSPTSRGHSIFGTRQTRPTPDARGPGMSGILDDLQALFTGGGAAPKEDTGPITRGTGATPGVYGGFANITGVQTALLGYGFDPGAIDDEWGTNTASAMRRFITSHGRVEAERLFGVTLVARALSMATGGGGGTPSADDITALLTTAGSLMPPATGFMAMVPAPIRGVVEHPAFVPVAAGAGLIGAALAWNRWGKKGKKRGKR